MGVYPGTPIFVGRTRELAELTHALQTIATGRGQLILLAGEPGIGKTRLTEEIATRARQQDVQVLVGRCWEGSGAPAFWPWVQIVRAYLQHCDTHTLPHDLGAGAAAVAQVVPELRERLPDLPTLLEIEPVQARFRFFDSFTLLLKRIATTQPILLVLDDLHWADTPSLLLLQFLARELPTMRVLVVGTYRDTEVDREHPLSEALGALARESQRIVLTGLSVGEVAQFIARTTRPSLSERLSHTVHSQTEGNPFFIGELLRLLDAEGRLLTPDVSIVDHSEVPQAVRETIRRRLARLSLVCQQMLTIAAVIGREFGTDILGRIHTNSDNLDRTVLLLALQEGISTRLISEVEGEWGRYRFVHALVRETVYEDLPLQERMQMHQQVGEAIEQCYAAYLHPYFAALADHFFQAAQGGDSEKALRYAVQAGERASMLLAYEEAVVHYERAVRLLDTTRTTLVRRCELLLAFGDAQTRAGATKKARTTFLQATDIARTLHAHGEQRAAGFFASAALGMAARTDAVTRFDQVLMDLLEEALRVFPDADSVVRVRLSGCLATVLYFSPAHQRRAALCQHALAMARRLGDLPTLAFALYANHFALQGPDNFDDRLAIASEIIRLAEEAGAKEIAIGGHFWRLLDLLEIGDREAFDLELQTYLRLTEELRQPSYRWRAAILRATRALLEGDLAEGERLVQEAFALGEQAQKLLINSFGAVHKGETVLRQAQHERIIRNDAHPPSVHPELVEGRTEGFSTASQSPNAFLVFAVQIFGLRKEQGRLAELEDPLKNFVDRYPAIPAFRSGLALVFSELGKTEEARFVFESLAATDFTIFPRDGNWLNAMDELSQVCAFLGDRQRASQLYALLLPYAHRTIVFGFAEGCNGSVSRHLGLLATTLGHWDDAEQHFTDALAANTRLRIRPFVAHTQYDYARMLLARGASGDNEQAVRFFDQALATARELGMVRLEEKIQQSVVSRQLSVTSQTEAGDGRQKAGAGNQHSETRSQYSVASSQHPAVSSPNDAELRPHQLLDSRQTPTSELPNFLRREGEYWTVSYEGTVSRLRPTKGFPHLACLLREPGREFHVLDLLAMTEREGPTLRGVHNIEAMVGTLLPDMTPVPDQQARESYRQRLQSLRIELAEAEQLNDLGRITALQAEEYFLTQELSTAYGLGHHARASSREIEKARKAVAYRIRTALEKIKKADHALWRHLFITIKTGVFCSYNPEKPTTWQV